MEGPDDQNPEDGHQDPDEQLEEVDDEPPTELQKLDLNLPTAELEFDLSSFIGPTTPSAAETEKYKKRASNVVKLSQENDKLKEELRAMTERLELAERRQKELLARNGGGRADT